MDLRYHNVTVDFPSYRRISYCSATTLCVAVTAQVVAGAWREEGSFGAGEGEKNVLFL